MRLDDQFGSGSLKAHTSLDAYDGIAHVGIATNGVRGPYLFYLLDGSHLVVEVLIVHSHNLALVEGYLERGFGLLGGYVLQVSLLRQSLCSVEQFASADAGAPDAHIIRIFQFGKVGKEAMLVQIVHLFLAGEFLVACQGDYLHAGCHHQEGHVEPYLVVAGSGATVGNGFGAYLVGIACNGYCLEDALAAHRDGIAVVAEHVAKNHVLQRFLVVLVGHVEGHIFHGTQFVGILLVFLQLLFAESAGIGTGGIHFIALLR